MKVHAINLDAAGKDEHAKLYKTLYMQVWDLLPTFCNAATDVATNFKLIARTLGSSLEDEELRSVVCSALVGLVNRCADAAGDGMDAETDGGRASAAADKAAVSAFAKNFLPILFNLFCTETTSESDKVRVLQAIEAFVSITNEALLSAMMKNVFAKLTEAMTAADTQKAGDGTIIYLYMEFITHVSTMEFLYILINHGWHYLF